MIDIGMTLMEHNTSIIIPKTYQSSNRLTKRHINNEGGREIEYIYMYIYMSHPSIHLSIEGVGTDLLNGSELKFRV